MKNWHQPVFNNKLANCPLLLLCPRSFAWCNSARLIRFFSLWYWLHWEHFYLINWPTSTVQVWYMVWLNESSEYTHCHTQTQKKPPKHNGISLSTFILILIIINQETSKIKSIMQSFILKCFPLFFLVNNLLEALSLNLKSFLNC